MLALAVGNGQRFQAPSPSTQSGNASPVVLSTWRHGIPANEGAWKVLQSGGSALDAVQAGVSVAEADLSNRSVGLGGLPDRDGFVTLDACIMDHQQRCGSVAFLQHILHPVQVARHIMDNTPHIMLVGEGAYQYALENGFERSKVEVPQPEVARQYQQWLKQSNYKPKAQGKKYRNASFSPKTIDNHDTIGMLALDARGNLSGACTTSGLAYKIHGRVGDSPIIGAGLFVDNEVGAATATGVGEMVIRIAGSHAIVELMRAGATPQEACQAAIERLIRKHPDIEGKQVGFLAMNTAGETGAYSIHPGFQFARMRAGENMLNEALFAR